MFATPAPDAEKRQRITVREAARRLGVADHVLYRAHKRGTIVAVEGADVLSFEEDELLRWAAKRKRLQQQGRPKGGAP